MSSTPLFYSLSHLVSCSATLRSQIGRKCHEDANNPMQQLIDNDGRTDRNLKPFEDTFCKTLIWRDLCEAASCLLSKWLCKFDTVKIKLQHTKVSCVLFFKCHRGTKQGTKFDCFFVCSFLIMKLFVPISFRPHYLTAFGREEGKCCGESSISTLRRATALVCRCAVYLFFLTSLLF